VPYSCCSWRFVPDLHDDIYGELGIVVHNDVPVTECQPVLDLEQLPRVHIQVHGLQLRCFALPPLYHSGHYVFPSPRRADMTLAGSNFKVRRSAPCL
jgi:hypothetical protein